MDLSSNNVSWSVNRERVCSMCLSCEVFVDFSFINFVQICQFVITDTIGDVTHNCKGGKIPQISKIFP